MKSELHLHVSVGVVFFFHIADTAYCLKGSYNGRKKLIYQNWNIENGLLNSAEVFFFLTFKSASET